MRKAFAARPSLRSIVMLVTVFIGIIASFVVIPTTHALSIFDGVNAARGTGQPAQLLGPSGILTTVVNILLFAVGALSVIMIIVGGLRYAISGGNSSAVTAAKNTILYALIGLVIAFLAYAIIGFVMNFLSGNFTGFSGSNYAPTSV